MAAVEQRFGTAQLEDGGRVAYALAGRGPFLLVAPGWLSHLELGWSIPSGPAAMVLWSLFAGGWILAIAATFAVDHLELTGLRQAGWGRSGASAPSAELETGGLYAFVRHPLLTGMLLAFWATPQMGASHLLFAVGATAYIAVGVRFEERDLRRSFGAAYDDYAARVPALLPRLPGRRGGATLFTPSRAQGGRAARGSRWPG